MADGDEGENFGANARIVQCESFINDVLKEDLKKVITRRDDIYSKIAEYLQLKRIIEQMMQQEKQNMSKKVLTDIGCNFYCQAEIYDMSKVLVCVGLDTFVEFTQEESLKFIDKKVSTLTKHAEKLSADISKIKAFIKVILIGLRDLQLLEFNNESSGREILL